MKNMFLILGILSVVFISGCTDQPTGNGFSIDVVARESCPEDDSFNVMVCDDSLIEIVKEGPYGADFTFYRADGTEIECDLSGRPDTDECRHITEIILSSKARCRFICGKNNPFIIDTFEECVAFGNPVMESYPRQCMTPEGRSFVEEIREPPMPPEDENVKAVNIAKQIASGLDSTIISDERTLMNVKSVSKLDCGGCWIVEIEYKLSGEGSDRIQKATVKVIIKDWEVADTSYSQVTDIALTSGECEAEGGRIAIIADSKGCSGDEAEIGDVIGLVSPGVCCIPNKTYCTEEQRNAQACTMEYRPVCGWFDESIQCIKYPCADTYSNPCMACSDEKVEYWTEGGCAE